jgi:hypothetical protein
MSVALAIEAAWDADEEPAKSRHLFLVEGVADWDALARLLAPFAVQLARLAEVRYSESGGRFSARLEVEGLSSQRAETLGEKLRQFPIVSSVSLGWRRLALAEG